MQMMSSTPWDAISIKMICDQADISRSTFYSHFESKDDLLNFAFQDLHQELSAKHPERAIDKNKQFSFIPPLLKHVSHHCDIFAMHSSSAAGMEIFGRFRGVIVKLAEEEIENAKLSQKLSDGEIGFLAGGIFSILENWNENRCSESIETITTRIDRIIARFLN